MVLFRKFKERAKMWLSGFAESRYARLIVFLHSIIDSSVFPLAVDFSVIPFSIARSKRAFQFALWASLGSVIGSIISYYIGKKLMETFGATLITFLNAESTWDYMLEHFTNSLGEIFLIIASITPISFTVAVLAAGAVEMDIYRFLFIVIIFRTLRFLVLAFFIYKYGAAVKVFFDKYDETLIIIFTIFVILFIVLFFIFG